MPSARGVWGKSPRAPNWPSRSPVFANGAVTGAFVQAFGPRGRETSAEEASGGGDVSAASAKEQQVADPDDRAVYSVSDGKVMRAGWQKAGDPGAGLGYRVSVQDADGYYQYGHLDPDSIQVQVGQDIKVGDRIGSYADPTNGRSSGPHVHLERRLWSNPRVTVNPGSVSPLGSGGRITAGWEARDAMHINPHQGTDWAYGR